MSDQFESIYIDPEVCPDPTEADRIVRALRNASIEAESAFYDLLYDAFYDEIQAWQWDGIVSEARDNPADSWDDSDLYGSCYLGSVLSLSPSGKYYTPYAHGNVSESEAMIDSLWFEALEQIARDNGGWIESGDGDPLDQYFAIRIDSDDSGE
jgi:hypothetical protein